MKQPSDLKIICSHCQAAYLIAHGMVEQLPKFCTYCGTALDASKARTLAPDNSVPSMSASGSASSIVFISGHQPAQENIKFTIGNYQIISAIGKGGMGEVFLAYDTTCGRRIALKRIRTDLAEHIQMHNRFLKEARITSQLTHPSIIPIYAIQGEDNAIYYTMPFVEGGTLKEILRKTRQQEKKGEKLDHVGGSIPALMRIFLSICQAIAYAHSKGVLHRDIKPENIVIGQYGEVLILDWGLAKLMHGETTQDEEVMPESSHHPLHQLTHLGRVVGTVSFMAPERAMGGPATLQTDIYSLGVILYQTLTLRHPFKRGTLKDFRENMHLETIRDPIEVAPYRDIPRVLARIALKAISPVVEQRYHSVDELIREIENYIEGRAEWFQIAELDIHNKADWEFQENVLIAEHVAITRATEVSDWVSLMISKSSFSENIKIEAKVRLGHKGHGIGFLLCIPEAAERTHLNDGYCLWLGSNQNRSTKLLRSTVEVMHAPEVYLQQSEWIQVRIEKMENNLYLYLNNALQFSYISHLPLVGTHVGLLSRDADFSIKDLKIFVGSQNVMVNCLAVPDAFLAHKDYTTALTEYRRIGYAFPGRAEGREAMFRAGITLLEQARDAKGTAGSEKLFDASLNEFEKLHNTPGAPLEYLGKALIYQALKEYEEEIKCFELAYRRYPKHPLLPILQEQIVYRMHASSRSSRLATYKFILLVVRHLPEVARSSNAKKLFASLRKHWEPLPFIQENPAGEGSETLSNAQLAIILAFWLAKPYVLAEIIDELIKAQQNPVIEVCNSLYCLVELGAWKIARQKLDEFTQKRSEIFSQDPKAFHMIHLIILAHEKSLQEAMQGVQASTSKKGRLETERAVWYLMRQTLSLQPESVETFYRQLQDKQMEFSEMGKILVDSYRIWAFLLQKKWDDANELLHHYSLELLNQDTTPLHFLYACWLYVVEGKDIASVHLAGTLEVAYPRTWSLFSHHFNHRIKEPQGWFQKAFLWEKRQLYKQLALFYHCVGDLQKELHYQALEKQECVCEEI